MDAAKSDSRGESVDELSSIDTKVGILVALGSDEG